MVFLLGLYITILTAANLGLMLYIMYERYFAFKKEGRKVAEQIMREHFDNMKFDQQTLLADMRNSVQTVISSTELSGQQTLQSLNDYMIKAHTEHLAKFSEFSSKLYSVLISSGNNFSEQMKQYVTDSNNRIEEWQSSYISVMKNEIDSLIGNEKQKLIEFTEQEKKRITSYIKEMAVKDTSIIVEEVLSNGISVKDQEKLAQQAVEKFFNEL